MYNIQIFVGDLFPLLIVSFDAHKFYIFINTSFKVSEDLSSSSPFQVGHLEFAESVWTEWTIEYGDLRLEF